MKYLVRYIGAEPGCEALARGVMRLSLVEDVAPPRARARGFLPGRLEQTAEHGVPETVTKTPDR
jgi:hypothetical protein